MKISNLGVYTRGRARLTGRRFQPTEKLLSNCKGMLRNVPSAASMQYDEGAEPARTPFDDEGTMRIEPFKLEAFCRDVVAVCSVLLVPGTVHDVPGHIRVGFGRQNMPEALAHLEAYLTEQGAGGR